MDNDRIDADIAFLRQCEPGKVMDVARYVLLEWAKKEGCDKRKADELIRSFAADHWRELSQLGDAETEERFKDLFIRICEENKQNGVFSALLHDEIEKTDLPRLAGFIEFGAFVGAASVLLVLLRIREFEISKDRTYLSFYEVDLSKLGDLIKTGYRIFGGDNADEQ